MEVGWTAVELGAGRTRKGESVDHAVGVVLRAKVGDAVSRGDELLAIHANDRSSLEAARERLLAAFSWSEEPVEPPPLIYQVIA
jgi:thymidine phosphorylase